MHGVSAWWEKLAESRTFIQYSVTWCQDTDRGSVVIKVNSTSKIWLKPLFKRKANVETAHVALYKCVTENLLRILMTGAESLNINALPCADFVLVTCGCVESGMGADISISA